MMQADAPLAKTGYGKFAGQQTGGVLGAAIVVLMLLFWPKSWPELNSVNAAILSAAVVHIAGSIGVFFTKYDIVARILDRIIPRSKL